MSATKQRFKKALTWLTYLPFAVSLTASANEDMAQRARTLLNEAVLLYQSEGERAFAALSRQGRFVQGDMYVYVVNTNGVMLASGGPSVMLVGRDIFSSLDPAMSERFIRATNEAQEGITYEGNYSWLSWSSPGSTQPKQIYYQRLGDKVFAVGLYQAVDKASEARTLLQRAAEAMITEPRATINAINTLSPDFYLDDLYVFAVDTASGRVVAHGSDLRTVGQDFKLLPGENGESIGGAILKKAESSNDLIEFNYRWRHPITGQYAVKQAYARSTGKYLVIVGHYRPGAR